MNWISKARNFFNMQTGETAAENSAQNQPLNQDDVDMKRRMTACMVLSGVGDAIGYNDGRWEFCPSGMDIQRELESMGGLSSLKPTKRRMIVSDDTVMHIATAEAILSESATHEEEYCTLARKYKQCMKDMGGRAPGLTCMGFTNMLKPDSKEITIPFNPRGGGCGAAMRAVPIGLLYWRPKEVQSLVRVAIEAGRMTHNHPTGFLGSVAVALFVSYAVQGREVREWGEGLLQTLSTAKQYCEQQKRDWESIRDSWSYFEDRWTDYVRNTIPSMDINLNPADYDTFVRSVSYMGTGGASGHDAPMIAYDAILRIYQVEDPPSRWETLCRYGMFHGGDSDSTGIIAGACYGAMFGMEGVPPNNYTQLEYRDRLEKLGGELFYKSRESGDEGKGTVPQVDPQNETIVPPAGTGGGESISKATDSNSQATESNLPATESNPPETESNLPATESNPPETESNLPATEINLPVTEGNLPATEGNLPATEINLPETESNLPATESNLPVTEGNLPATESNLPVTEGNLPATESDPKESDSMETEVSPLESNAIPKQSIESAEPILNQPTAVGDEEIHLSEQEAKVKQGDESMDTQENIPEVPINSHPSEEQELKKGADGDTKGIISSL